MTAIPPPMNITSPTLHATILFTITVFVVILILSFIFQVEVVARGEGRVVPVGRVVRLQVTASDVIHAWKIPAFGVHMDAVPGRLNETWFQVDEPGIYFGQCSELCGINHAYMPITVKAVSDEQYAQWIQSQGGEMVGFLADLDPVQVANAD